MKMTPYPAYKPTNINWIGEIPEHWNLTKVKFISSIFGRIGYRGYTVEDIVDEGLGAITISPSNIKNDTFNLDSTTSISWEKYFESPEIKIFSNDIILVKTGSTIGKTAIIPANCPEMTINPQLIVLKNIKIDSKFFYYQTTCDFFKNSFEIEQTGSTTPTISQEKVNLFPIIEIHSLLEQQAIVTYLDQKTALIDELIAKKERKIELLKENRTAIINHAVTKGLDSTAKLKPSGIDWIGEIPVHWELKKAKYLLNPEDGIKIGPFGSALKLETLTDSGIKIYGQGNVIKNNFEIGERYLTQEKFEAEFKQYEILEGDVLVTMMGTTGKSKVFSSEFEKGILDSHLLRLRFQPNKFISYLFTVILEKSDYIFHQLRLNSKGSIMEGLNSSIVKDLIILTPNIDEQKQIVTYLDTQTNLIDQTINLEIQKIEKLKEYRQSLISNVVTGKVCVLAEA